ncbi:hypothetical protein KJA15_02090 [Patescibacteria group bacterium]|nr:hypothetical protein [Patescibacteria group bacterium]
MNEVIQKIWSFLNRHKEAIILIAGILTIAGFIITDVRGVLKDYLELQVEKKETDFLFSMKQKCREEGEKIVGEQGEKIGCSYEYTYNKKLHTCLLYYNCGTTKRVKDILTNETLISYPSINSPINTPFYCFSSNTLSELPLISTEGKISLYDCFLSEERFFKEKQKLFNQ